MQEDLRYSIIFLRQAINFKGLGGVAVEIYKNVNTKIQEIDEVICNYCGNKIDTDSLGYRKDYIHIEKRWGYNSEKDGDFTEIDICEKCFDKILNDCKVMPKTIE